MYTYMIHDPVLSCLGVLTVLCFPNFKGLGKLSTWLQHTGRARYWGTRNNKAIQTAVGVPQAAVAGASLEKQTGCLKNAHSELENAR